MTATDIEDKVKTLMETVNKNGLSSLEPKKARTGSPPKYSYVNSNKNGNSFSGLGTKLTELVKVQRTINANFSGNVFRYFSFTNTSSTTFEQAIEKQSKIIGDLRTESLKAETEARALEQSIVKYGNDRVQKEFKESNKEYFQQKQNLDRYAGLKKELEDCLQSITKENENYVDLRNAYFNLNLEIDETINNMEKLSQTTQFRIQEMDILENYVSLLRAELHIVDRLIHFLGQVGEHWHSTSRVYTFFKEGRYGLTDMRNAINGLSNTVNKGAADILKSINNINRAGYNGHQGNLMIGVGSSLDAALSSVEGVNSYLSVELSSQAEQIRASPGI